MTNKLPEISWPEKSDKDIEQQVIVDVSKLINEHVCEFEIMGNTIYILVPDPPDDFIPVSDWVEEHIKNGFVKEESQYELLRWGARGIAIVVFNKNLFTSLLGNVFRLSSNNTIVIAAERLDFHHELKDYVPNFIKLLMTNVPTQTNQMGYYYGLLFDWGELIEIFEGHGADSK